jgi:MYXO-CTERM domain-containing protein
VLLNQPVQKTLEGRIYSTILRVAHEASDDNPLQFLALQLPKGMVLTSLGKSGCCVSRALLLWKPGASDVRAHVISVQATNTAGEALKIQFNLEVLSINHPPQWNSQPVTQAIQGRLYTYTLQASDSDKHSQRLKFRLLEGPEGMTLEAGGLLKWTPTARQSGTWGVVLEVMDPLGARAFQRFLLKVTPTLAAASIVSVPLTSGHVKELYLYKLQVQGAPLGKKGTFRLRTTTAQGLQLNERWGWLRWIPSKAGTFSIEVEVNIGASTPLRQQWQVKVSDASNQKPVITNFPSSSATQGRFYKSTLKATDADKDNLQFVLVQAPTGMSLKVLSSGEATLEWTPTQEQVGTQRLEVRIDDGRGGVVRERWQIQVAERNDPPRIVSQPRIAIPQDSDYRYVVQAKDPDPGDSLRFLLYKAPVGMKIDSERGLLTWKATSANVGKKLNIVVAVRDRQGLEARQSFVLTVLDRNDPPRFSSTASTTIPEGQEWVYKPIVQDPDSKLNLVSFHLVQGPQPMTLDTSKGELRWKTKPGDRGIYSIILKAVDSEGGIGLQQFSLVVQARNHAPQIVSQPITGAVAGSLYRYQLKVKDPDPGDLLTFQLLEGPRAMQMDSSTGVLTWKPTAENVDQQKNYSIKVRVTDQAGTEANQSFTLTLRATNQFPVLDSVLPTKATEGTLLTTILKVKDADGDKVSFVLEKAPVGVSLNATSGEIRWVPRQRDVGTHSLEVRCDDGRGGVLYLRWLVQVQNVNNPPFIQTLPLWRAQVGRDYVYLPRATDPDHASNTLRWTLVKGPTGMSIDGGTGRVLWSPLADQQRVQDVEIKVTDAAGASFSQKYRIWVASGVQDLQFAVGSPVRATVDQWLFLENKLSSRPASDPLPLFFLRQAPQGMEVGVFSGLLRWKPSSLDTPSVDVVLGVESAGGLTSQRSFILPVNGVPARPLLTSTPPKTVVAGKSWEYQLRFGNTAAELATFSSTLLEHPTGMQLDSSHRLLWATSLTDQSKSFLVTLEVSNGQDASVFQSFVIRVLPTTPPANRAPQWKTSVSGTLNLNVGLLWSTRVTALDPDGDVLRYRLQKGPAGVSIREREGTLSWLPSRSQISTKPWDVEVVVMDGRGGQAVLRFRLQVNGGNQPPIILSKPISQVKSTLEFRYAMRVKDPDHRTSQLTALLIEAPKGMTLTGLTLRWFPTVSQVGLHRVRVRVSDPDSGSAEQSFWVRVWAQNTSPVITSRPALLVLEGKRFWYETKVSDADLPDETLRFELLQGPDGMRIHAETGIVHWTPDNNDAIRGQHVIQLQVRDSAGNSAQQQFTLTVVNQNNPPQFTSLPCQKAQVGLSYNCVVFAEDLDPNTTSLSLSLLQGPGSMKLNPPRLTRVNGRLQAIAILEWRPGPGDIGVHQVELRVSDGQQSSLLPFSVSVGLEEDVPLAFAGEEKTVSPGLIQLDGSQSRNSVKTPLRYEWSLLRGPVKTVTFREGSTAKPSVILKTAGVYTFQLIVKNDTQTSAPSFVNITVKNIAPSAEIFAPSGGKTGQTLTLNGSASADSNGDPLVYQWSQSSGPSVTLQKNTTKEPTFVPQKPGVYTFQLVVREEVKGTSTGLRSEEASVTIVVHDPDKNVFVPEAVILLPTSIVVGNPVVLDGTRSRKLGGGSLRYAWSVVSGPGTSEELAQTLSTPKAVTTTWSPQKPGYYRLGLVVENDNLRSSQKVVGIVVQGRKNEKQVPYAQVRSGYALLEQWTTLDASQSVDPNKGQLSFNWTQIGGPPVELRDPRTARPSFFALQKASYRFRVDVSSGAIPGAPAEVTIHVNAGKNQPPQAMTGPSLVGDKAVNAGVSIELDGSQSNDTDGNKLQYRWRQLSGIPVAVQGANDAKASFVPFTYGIWTFALEVYDGVTWSSQKQLAIVVNDKNNQLPVADAGPDQVKRIGEGVTLNGSASKDADGDSLTYFWRLVSPPDAPISLNVSDPQYPTFSTKNLPSGEYVFGLRVDDGKSRSLEDLVTIRIAGNNRPPKAFVKPVGNVVVEDLVVLDGTQSSDPDGDKLEYIWTQLSGPPVQLNQNKTGEASFTPTSAEVYKFQLQVRDGKAQSSPFEVTIQVKEKDLSGGCQCSSPPSSPLPVNLLWLLGLALWWRKRRR